MVASFSARSGGTPVALAISTAAAHHPLCFPGLLKVREAGKDRIGGRKSRRFARRQERPFANYNVSAVAADAAFHPLENLRQVENVGALGRPGSRRCGASRQMEFLTFEGAQAFFTVVMIDLVLAGDNAVVIGLAA